MATTISKDPETPIVILVYNGWDMVLSNLAIMTHSFRDVWIIDNNSKTDMSNAIASQFPNIRYLRLDDNYGWAGGYNRAISHIQKYGYSSIFILNSDAIIDAPSVRSAIRGLNYNKRAAAVGSIILDQDGKNISYDGNFLFNNSTVFSDKKFPELAEAKYIHGAGFALNLAAYHDVGPFYEPYFLYHEEADWCSRAKKKGYGIFVSGNSFCYHKGIASSTNENRAYYVTRNAFLALKRNHALDDKPNSWIGLVVEGCNFSGADKNFAAAHWDGLLDGVFGRFGKRRRSWNSAIRNTILIVLKILAIPPRLLRKLRLIYF